jgi:hypothetical protein
MDVNLERVVETAKMVVAERGADYVYKRPTNTFGVPTCLYVDVDRDQPSCLVGHVLHRLGVPLETLKSADQFSFPATDVCHDLLGGSAFDDGEISHFLDAVQSRQDIGRTWGEALQNGLEALDVTRGVA